MRAEDTTMWWQITMQCPKCQEGIDGGKLKITDLAFNAEEEALRLTLYCEGCHEYSLVKMVVSSLVNECRALDPVLRTRLPLELSRDDIALLRFGHIGLT